MCCYQKIMLDIRPVNSELRTFAKEKLNEDPQKIEEMLKEFCLLIDEMPHLSSRRDDQFLIAFLRSSKFDLKEAKQQLDNFYTIRNQLPDFIRGNFATHLRHFLINFHPIRPRPIMSKVKSHNQAWVSVRTQTMTLTKIAMIRNILVWLFPCRIQNILEGLVTISYDRVPSIQFS